MSQIITRGFGDNIITRGYGEVSKPKNTFAPIISPFRRKEYILDLIVPISFPNEYDFEIYAPIIQYAEGTIQLTQPVLISKEEQLMISAPINNPRLKLIYKILKVI